MILLVQPRDLCKIPSKEASRVLDLITKAYQHIDFEQILQDS